MRDISGSFSDVQEKVRLVGARLLEKMIDLLTKPLRSRTSSSPKQMPRGTF
jgi:hypothetical protein